MRVNGEPPGADPRLPSPDVPDTSATTAGRAAAPGGAAADGRTPLHTTWTPEPAEEGATSSPADAVAHEAEGDTAGVPELTAADRAKPDEQTLPQDSVEPATDPSRDEADAEPDNAERLAALSGASASQEPGEAGGVRERPEGDEPADLQDVGVAEPTRGDEASAAERSAGPDPARAHVSPGPNDAIPDLIGTDHVDVDLARVEPALDPAALEHAEHSPAPGRGGEEPVDADRPPPEQPAVTGSVDDAAGWESARRTSPSQDVAVRPLAVDEGEADARRGTATADGPAGGGGASAALEAEVEGTSAAAGAPAAAAEDVVDGADVPPGMVPDERPTPSEDIGELPETAQPEPDNRTIAEDTSSVLAAVGEPGGPDLGDPGRLRAAVEAVLLVVDTPTGAVLMAQVLGMPVEAVETALRGLRDEYDADRRGIDLREVAGGWRLYSREDFAPYVERFVLEGQQTRLTQAALETLAVVAYRQPITRSRVSAIRGVNVDAVMRTLLSRGLVEECGSDSETGGGLYRTTQFFLERLGIGSLEELPSLAPLLPDTSQLDDVALST